MEQGWGAYCLLSAHPTSHPSTVAAVGAAVFSANYKVRPHAAPHSQRNRMPCNLIVTLASGRQLTEKFATLMEAVVYAHVYINCDVSTRITMCKCLSNSHSGR